MSCKIHIGIAGWTYKDWDRIVYTSGKIDRLEYLSRFVDCIEINSTFYRPPEQKNCSSWFKKVPSKPDFFFTAKLLKDFTHEGKIEPKTVKQFNDGFLNHYLKQVSLKSCLLSSGMILMTTKTTSSTWQKL